MTAKYSAADEHLTLEESQTPKACIEHDYVNVSPSGFPIPLPRKGTIGALPQQRPWPVPKPRSKSKPGPPVARKPQHLHKGSTRVHQKAMKQARATLNPRGNNVLLAIVQIALSDPVMYIELYTYVCQVTTLKS